MGRKDDFVNIPMEKKDYLINLDYELIKIGENRAEERCKRRIAELEATVEQMKCCQNCIHMDDDFPCEYEHGVPRDNKCDKWEAK